MRIKVAFEKNTRNRHGTQKRGEPWNNQTVRGWKLCSVDLLQPIKEREKLNPEGGKTRARWYRRIILYFPSGAWWNLDIALLAALGKTGGTGK